MSDETAFGCVIAVMKSGARIAVYTGEGADADCFAGGKLDPTERELRLNTHISCMWSRDSVERLEFADCGADGWDETGASLRARAMEGGE